MARELAYFYAPYVNSYKRYQAGLFAPTRIVAGWDNRTCGFRLCGEGSGFRVENRIPGADANPYLASPRPSRPDSTASRRSSRRPALRGQRLKNLKLPQVPKTAREAVAELERSRVAPRGARRRGGRALPPHRAARAAGVDQVVTDWELMRGFERI